jgi:GTPase SAR1 family protein
LILAGPGRAGKTSLVNSLMEKDFNDKEVFTIGSNYFEVTVAVNQMTSTSTSGQWSEVVEGDSFHETEMTLARADHLIHLTTLLHRNWG